MDLPYINKLHIRILLPNLNKRGHALTQIQKTMKASAVSIIRIALTFVAALALYALVMPISAFAATPTTIEVSNSSEFDNAVATVNAATSGEYIIELTDDIQTGGASFSSSQPVSIVGNGHTIALKQYGSISIDKGAELDLGSKNGGDSLTISGGNVNSNDVPGLLYVQGSCNMYSGVTVSTVRATTTSAAVLPYRAARSICSAAPSKTVA